MQQGLLQWICAFVHWCEKAIDGEGDYDAE